VAALPPQLVQFEPFPNCQQSPMHLNAQLFGKGPLLVLCLAAPHRDRDIGD